MEIEQRIELIFQQLEQMFLQLLIYDFPFFFAWNRNFLRSHLLWCLRPFLKLKINHKFRRYKSVYLFLLTGKLDFWLNRWIHCWTVAWFDNNKEQWWNQNHCSHCDYAEDQIQEKHSKQQNWLKRITLKSKLEEITKYNLY